MSFTIILSLQVLGVSELGMVESPEVVKGISQKSSLLEDEIYLYTTELLVRATSS